MVNRQRTMQVVSYGFSRPKDLFEKLKRDAAKLNSQPSPDDVFNFLVTAASLYDWVRKFYNNSAVVGRIAAAIKDRKWQTFPEAHEPWLADRAYVPNDHLDERHHIINALRICWETAGASKHFYWEGYVRDVQPAPIVLDWYQYFFTSTKPDLYVDYDGEVYGLSQIRSIVLQFYEQLLAVVDNEYGCADA